MWIAARRRLLLAAAPAPIRLDPILPLHCRVCRFVMLQMVILLCLYLPLWLYGRVASSKLDRSPGRLHDAPAVDRSSRIVHIVVLRLDSRSVIAKRRLSAAVLT